MTAEREQVLAVLREVSDPEIPALDVVEMGIVRDVAVDEAGVEVVITPTSTGCPALRVIEQDIVACLRGRGHRRVSVRVALSPAWTTDWLGPEARRKLEESGIAPPPRGCARGDGEPPATARCPRCGATTSGLVSAFGSTPCKALFRCTSCREPFELFKRL